MRKIKRLILTAVLIAMSQVHAEDIRGWAEVNFFGTSTLHDFDGRVRSRIFTIEVEQDKVTLEDFRGLQIKIPVKKMDTGNRRMNKNMYKMFEADEYPTIIARVPAADNSADEPENDPVEQLVFDVEIRDIKKTLAAALKDTIRSDKYVSFKIELEVSLKDFKLKPPTMLGIMRVGDNVRVEAELVLQKRNPGE